MVFSLRSKKKKKESKAAAEKADAAAAKPVEASKASKKGESKKKGEVHLNDDGEPIIELEEGWANLYKNGIVPFLDVIESGSQRFFKAKDFVLLYDIVFQMCIQHDPFDWSQDLYKRYSQTLRDYIQQRVVPAMQQAITRYDADVLNEWRTRWNQHKLIVRGLAKLFTYLDRFYTPHTDNVLSLKDEGFNLYHSLVFEKFHEAARKAILSCIQKERQNEPQDRELLKDSVMVFAQVGYNVGNRGLSFYVNHLESHLLRDATAYYRGISRVWIEQDSAHAYLVKCQAKLDEESARVDAYLNRTTRVGLRAVVVEQLIKSHQRGILDKKTGLSHMLQTHNVGDIKLLYGLFSLWPDGPAEIADTFREHVRKQGLEIVQSSQGKGGGGGEAKDEGKDGGGKKKLDKMDVVQALIDLHARYGAVVNDCFARAVAFQRALKVAFEEFINIDSVVSSVLARYVHEVMRKGSKINVPDLEGTLDNCVFLYGYIQEKDVFEGYFQKHLSTRLLEGLCRSEHAEKSMIAKLKTEAGYQWTNKLEGMFKDVHLSKDLMKAYNALYADDDSEASQITLDVTVCTTGMWPAPALSKNAKLPQDLVVPCERFKRFYLNQHSGHRLNWSLDQGKAEIQVSFGKGVKRTLTLTTVQMMIFLVFNDVKTPTLKQIMEHTGLTKRELGSPLLSLCHPNVKVLAKKPNNKQLEDSHMFRINPKYSSKYLKVDIPNLRNLFAGGDDDGVDAMQASIELQRQHQIDAATVRIMKTRKQLKHALLVAEVSQQLGPRFPVTPSMVKRRIQALIRDNYLERDKEDRSIYNYLA